MTLRITGEFDGGNIRVKRIHADGADLEIVPDQQSDFYQWFNFRVSGAAGRKLTLRIVNCAGSAYPDGWAGYQARVTDDGLHWRCTPTRYSQGILTIDAEAASDFLQVAYFAPYTSERHTTLLAHYGAAAGVGRRVLGCSIEGRALEMLSLGSGPVQVWLIARQHPGETMAQWWIEGALEELTSASTPSTVQLRELATFHIVPNMNPDGSARGHLRTNAVGVNLNREWQSPSLDRSPEVFHVLRAMEDTGLDMAIDVHGHEVAMRAFTAAARCAPARSAHHAGFYSRFAGAVARRNPAFQIAADDPELTELSMAAPQLAERFGALAMALEMPFKDASASADPETGWSPKRSKMLARDCMAELATMLISWPR
jgi:murein tripeptide amidase MpaA